jgi:glycosyltransferase involved in cell wall biosynthesis
MIVEVLASEGLHPVTFVDRLHGFRPDLVHVHHAYKTATLILDPLVETHLRSLPVVVSPGGTDINLDFDRADARETIFKVLRMARVILTQSLETVQSLRRKMPDVAQRIINVPKAFSWFGDEPFDLRSLAGCDPDDVLFFMPAGVRPVKGNLECLLALERVHAIRPKIRFAAAGPAVDAEYTLQFERELDRLKTFARWIGSISPAAMRSAYEASDIVLNASFSEGLSNSMLEAMAAGKPILASDIPGNREPVLGEAGDLNAGCLFDPYDLEDFIDKAIRLVDSEHLRETLSNAAKLRKSKMPDAAEEANGLLTAYQAAIGKS